MTSLGLSLLLLPGIATAAPTLPAAPATPPDLRAQYQGPAAQWPTAWLDADIAPATAELAPLPRAAPAGPLALLGEHLFADPILSADGQMRCLNCHQPRLGWSDPWPRAIGPQGQPGRRNSPSVQGSNQLRWLGWDGASRTLPLHLWRALTHPDEMGEQTLTIIVARLDASPSHRAAFLAASGAPPTAASLLQALTHYLATVDQPTPLDRFLRGDTQALDDQQLLGLHLFRTQARCLNCHQGARLTDQQFHNLGLSFVGSPSEDLGRYGVTGQLEDSGRFRTPSLRHVSQRGPYMHNGLFDELHRVVRFYRRGGGDTRLDAATALRPEARAAQTRSEHLQPLTLTEDDIAALAAFLQAL